VIDALRVTKSDGLRSLDPETFGAHWRKQSLIEIQGIADEAAPWPPFDPVLESSMHRTLTDLGVTRNLASDRTMRLKARERLPFRPEAPGALTRLRRKYLLAPHIILSLHVAAFSSRVVGLTWDAINSCNALRSTKPNHNNYSRARHDRSPRGAGMLRCRLSQRSSHCPRSRDEGRLCRYPTSRFW
jgi:2-haloacid dehalogenase